jgi:hypothetical protein
LSFNSRSAGDLLGAISGVFGREWHPVGMVKLLSGRLSATHWFHRTHDGMSKSLSTQSRVCVVDPGIVGEPHHL